MTAFWWALFSNRIKRGLQSWIRHIVHETSFSESCYPSNPNCIPLLSHHWEMVWLEDQDSVESTLFLSSHVTLFGDKRHMENTRLSKTLLLFLWSPDFLRTQPVTSLDETKVLCESGKAFLKSWHVFSIPDRKPRNEMLGLRVQESSMKVKNKSHFYFSFSWNHWSVWAMELRWMTRETRYDMIFPSVLQVGEDTAWSTENTIPQVLISLTCIWWWFDLSCHYNFPLNFLCGSVL